MEARFINGSTVTRLWGDDVTELLGAFAFRDHAVRFAEMLAENSDVPTATVRYLVYCHCDGKSTIVVDRRNVIPKQAQPA